MYNHEDKHLENVDANHDGRELDFLLRFLQPFEWPHCILDNSDEHFCNYLHIVNSMLNVCTGPIGQQVELGIGNLDNKMLWYL